MPATSIIIENYLKDEKERSTKIALLNLNEVNLYIDTVKSMQKDIDTAIKNGLALMGLPIISTEKIRQVVYGKYKFNLYTPHDSVDPRFKALQMEIDPIPPFESLSNLLLELQQQKEFLEKIEKTHDKITQKIYRNQLMKRASTSTPQHSVQASESLDESEIQEEKESKIDIESIKESIKEGQDRVALQALESYHGLVDQHKELIEKFKSLELQETQKSALLEATLSQNEKLQQDIRILQSQLAGLVEEKQKSSEAAAIAQGQVAELKSTLSQNEKFQQDIRVLQSQLAGLAEEKQKISESAALTQSYVAEQKAELSRLKQQEPLASNIKRAYLVDLLSKFNYKAEFSLFSSNSNDQTLENLKNLSELKQELISIKQIINCIEDPVILKIFNDPSSYHDARLLTKTGLIIRELAFLFREPQLLPKVSNNK